MDTYVVQAEYSFKGENNDELCFKKGDVITVTQREDGGWWEGTLGEMTGWFPSNYVKEYSGELYLLLGPRQYFLSSFETFSKTKILISNFKFKLPFN